jgi:hypothetical protein
MVKYNIMRIFKNKSYKFYFLVHVHVNSFSHESPQKLSLGGRISDAIWLQIISWRILFFNCTTFNPKAAACYQTL